MTQTVDHVISANQPHDWNYLDSRTVFPSRALVLEMVVRLSYQIPGNIIEFGVAEGGSTRIIRRTATACEKNYSADAKKVIFACDSFEGLREKFENAEVGTFKTKPPVIPGVQIVKGYFEDSLTDELASKVGRIAFASLDADLFSSTICALKWMTPLLGTGSLLLFDEYIGENESEKRAFKQWSTEYGIETMMIADFVREPSGWGAIPDRRTLFQVIGKEELAKRSPLPSLKQKVDRGLAEYPRLRSAARSVYNLLK